ncbi:hypothetical protein ACQY0O_002603 [Thecaphora frezii]
MAHANAPSPYRPSLDEDVDPRYATESYQHQTTPHNPSNNLVLDAASAVESHHHQPFSASPLASSQPAWSLSGPPRLADHGGFSQSFNTSQSWSLSSVCAIAWALPPFSSLLVLLWETENDLARFHAYQSGICGVALIAFLWLVRSILGLKTIGLLMGMAAVGWFWVCGSTAHKAAPSLARNPYLPRVGDIASRWVGEE